MKRIDMKIGFKCNNYCKFCVQGNKRYECKDKTTDEIKISLKKGREIGANSLIFTGGEPTIRFREIIEWIKFAKQIGYQYIHLQTNGRTLAYLDYCKKLIDAGVNQFGPSIHGSKASIHDNLTRSSGSWSQTVQGIKNLKKLKQEILSNTVVTKLNYKDMPDIAKLLVGLRVNQFQFAFMHINSIIANDPKLIKELVPRFNVIMPYIIKGINIGTDANIPAVTEAIPYCFMKGYENHIAENKALDTYSFDATIEREYTSKIRKHTIKATGLSCKSCMYFENCEGTWKEYAEIFGWSEFRPVLKQ